MFGHVKDGRLVKIEGNPDLFSEGTLCGRCFAIPQELYNPLRVRYPQKRVGEKGSGQWKRITWEEAYQEAADRFTKIGEEHGWHTIAHQYGTCLLYTSFAMRFKPPMTTRPTSTASTMEPMTVKME